MSTLCIAAFGSLLLMDTAPAPPPQTILAFEQALDAVIRTNPQVQKAEARLDKAHELSRQAWSYYLPHIELDGSYTRNSTESRFGPNVILPYNKWSGRAKASQALVAPALWPAIQNAYLAEQIASLTAQNVRRELVLAAARLYYAAATMREATQVQRDLLQAAAVHEKDARVRFEAGEAPKNAVLRAEIDRVRAEQDVRRTANAYEVAKSALAALLAREPDFEVGRPGDLKDPSPEHNTIEGALQRRPDNQAAHVSVDLAAGQRRRALYQYAPQLAAYAQYEAQNIKGLAGQYDTWLVMVNLTWTAWDGGLRESLLREAEAQEAEAAASLRETEVDIADQVRRARLDLQSAQANRLQAEVQAHLARENNELARVNYEAGAANYIETSDAHTALVQAELARINEGLNAQLASINLASALGVL